MVNTLVATLEFVSMMLLIASVQVTDAEAAASLGSASFGMLLTASLLPAALSIYDGLALPMARAIATGSVSSRCLVELSVAALVTVVDTASVFEQLASMDSLVDQDQVCKLDLVAEQVGDGALVALDLLPAAVDERVHCAQLLEDRRRVDDSDEVA